MTDYKWLEREPTPKMLVAGLSTLGTKEIIGDSSNPVILEWAKDLGITDYKTDSTPWCGLWIAHVAKLAGKEIIENPLWARNWAKWGTACKPELGCVLVFMREGGGGHVGLYVGEDATSYHVLGGNQSDMVCVTRLAKNRLLAARCSYKIKPSNVRPVFLESSGTLSSNEA